MTAVLETLSTAPDGAGAPISARSRGWGPGGEEAWADVCAVGDLIPDRGVCALVDGRQVAIFRVSPTDELYAVGNHDPYSAANVMSRGIVGSRGDVAKVASPMYKQSFDLRTGLCLDDPSVALPVYAVRENDGRVEVSLT